MSIEIQYVDRDTVCRSAVVPNCIFNKVCGYSCMENKEVYFVVDTSCKMALIHQAAILHYMHLKNSYFFFFG